MDRVRFGRALGMGAREAARAVMKAADAAKAPSPESRQTGNPVVERKAEPVVIPTAGQVHRQRERAKVSVAGVKRGGKKFGEAMWGPFAKASSVLWLEVTGVLFGMFALVAGSWAWSNRLDLAGSGKPAHQEWLRIGMMAVFGYLTVSSYVRAARRGRQ
jgi:hypothetical protein